MCKYSIQFNISLRKSSKTYLAYTLFRETTKKNFHLLDLGHKILIKTSIFLNFNFCQNISVPVKSEVYKKILIMIGRY